MKHWSNAARSSFEQARHAHDIPQSLLGHFVAGCASRDADMFLLLLHLAMWHGGRSPRECISYCFARRLSLHDSSPGGLPDSAREPSGAGDRSRGGGRWEGARVSEAKPIYCDCAPGSLNPGKAEPPQSVRASPRRPATAPESGPPGRGRSGPGRGGALQTAKRALGAAPSPQSESGESRRGGAPPEGHAAHQGPSSAGGLAPAAGRARQSPVRDAPRPPSVSRRRLPSRLPVGGGQRAGASLWRP